MKPLKQLALSSFLLLTAHSLSFAATYTLHVTGATALRASTHNAIVNYLFAQSGVDPVGAYKGSNVATANQAIFKGTINGGADTLIVEADWTGAVQGIYDTSHANALSNAWIDPSNTLSTVTHATAPSLVTGGTSLSAPVYATAIAPDVTLSNAWQSSTLFPTPALTEVIPNGIGIQVLVPVASPGTAANVAPISGTLPLTTTSGSTTVSLDPSIVALLSPGDFVGSTANIPPFATVISTNPSAGTIVISVPATGTGTTNSTLSYSGFTNLTSQQLRALYTNGTGTLPLSQFTGVSSDSTRTVVGIGRNPDAGTRVIWTLESGIGNTTSLSQVSQVFPYDSSNNIITNATTQIDHFGLTPSVVYNGLTLSVGDNGYSSDSQLSSVLQNGTVSSAGYFFVSVLGLTDATNAVKGGALPLTYNGVAYNAVNVQNGEYSLWSYTHLYQSTALSGQALISAKAIGNQILTSDASITGDLISNQHVSRHPINVDGSVVY